jgi:NADH:ubiquinone oxidoreductase subunit 6 (subunit J)
LTVIPGDPAAGAPALAHPPPPPGYRDRSGLLTFFGVVEILIGGLCALLGVLGALALSLVPRAGVSPGPAAPPRLLWVNLLVYAAAAVFLITMGIGTLRAKRWARVLMLITSWPAFLTFVLGTVWIIMLMPGLMAQSSDASPEAARIAMIGIVVFSAFLALVPLSFILFYSGRNVRATFESRDRTPTWVDGRPMPILGLTVAMWGCGAFTLLALPRGMTAFFGLVLTGSPAVGVILLQAFVWVWLGRQIYWMTRAGWWANVVLVTLGHLSGWVTFRTVGWDRLIALYAGEDAIRAIDPSMMATMRGMMLWVTPASLVLWLLTLVWLRWRYYHAGGDPLRSTGCLPC